MIGSAVIVLTPDSSLSRVHLVYAHYITEHGMNLHFGSLWRVGNEVGPDKASSTGAGVKLVFSIVFLCARQGNVSS